MTQNCEVTAIRRDTFRSALREVEREAALERL